MTINRVLEDRLNEWAFWRVEKDRPKSVGPDEQEYIDGRYIEASDHLLRHLAECGYEELEKPMTDSAAKARQDYEGAKGKFVEAVGGSQLEEADAALDAAALALVEEGIKLGVKWQRANHHLPRILDLRNRSIHEIAQALLKGEWFEKP